MRHTTLRNRIKRIEARRKFQRKRPSVVYAVYDIPEAHVVGMAAPSGPVAERQKGESFAALARRHGKTAGFATIGFAVYRAGKL